MKACFCAALIGMCLLAPPGLAQSAQYKGWEAISRELSTRMAPKDKPFNLDEFLPAESMDELLGTLDDAAEAAVAQLASTLSPTEFTNSLIETLRAAYTPGAGMAQDDRPP